MDIVTTREYANRVIGRKKKEIEAIQREIDEIEKILKKEKFVEDQ